MMEMTIRALRPEDAGAALKLMRDCCQAGEVLYKPLEEADFRSRFFGEERWGFAAEAEGRLIGWAQAAGKTRFLDGETRENTPLYLTMVLVEKDCRGQGVGKALLEAVRQAGAAAGKKMLVVSGDNPVHLTWLIPGAGGHDHNNAPGVNEDTPGYGYLAHLGFHDDYHEISMYLNLKDYRWDPALDTRIAALEAEGIRVGRWTPEAGQEFDGMCDRVGSEYWRNVLRQELAAWRENRPNSDPECWPDGVMPSGPRPLLTATKDGHIIGFTGPVDLQKSGRGWFTGICTDPAWGGRGIATVLFNLLMREFVAEGASFCSLFTGVSNHAQKIYLRAGLHVAARWAVMSKPLENDARYDHRYF